MSLDIAGAVTFLQNSFASYWYFYVLLAVWLVIELAPRALRMFQSRAVFGDGDYTADAVNDKRSKGMWKSRYNRSMHVSRSMTRRR